MWSPVSKLIRYFLLRVQVTFVPLELMYGIWWSLFSSSPSPSTTALLAQPLTVLAWLGLPRTVLRLALDLTQTLRHLDDHILHESCHRPSLNDADARSIGSGLSPQHKPVQADATRSRRPSGSVPGSRRKHGRALSFGAWRVFKVVRCYAANRQHTNHQTDQPTNQTSD